MNISSLSQNELSQQVLVAIQAVSAIEELETKMKKVGFTAEKLNIGLYLHQEVINWQERQEETQDNAQKAQRNLSQIRDAIDSIYIKHRFAARYIYRENEDMCKKLNLLGLRSRRFTLWLEEVQHFYDQLNVEAITEFENLNDEAVEVKKLLAQLSEFQSLHNDCRRQAQHITEVKRKAILKLRHWFRYFISTAEHACKDNAQLLEEMGVELNIK